MGGCVCVKAVIFFSGLLQKSLSDLGEEIGAFFKPPVLFWSIDSIKSIAISSVFIYYFFFFSSISNFI